MKNPFRLISGRSGSENDGMIKVRNSPLCDVFHVLAIRFARVAWLCGFVSLLAACSLARETTADYSQFRAKLDGEDVLVGYFKGI
jgi:hypothetical protein